MSTIKTPLAGLSGERLKLVARKVNSRRRNALPTIVRQPGSSYPASFAQERLWLVQKLLPDLPSYNVPAVVRLPMAARVDIWEDVMRSIAGRHEVMRTSLQQIEGELRQVVDERPRVRIGFLDLRGFPESERDAAAHAHVRADIARPFELSESPLWRVGVIAMGEQECILHVTAHHSVCDSASLAIFQREAQLTVQALMDGHQPPNFGELSVQYGDFARWQRARAAAEGKEALAYWRGNLADLPTLDLPIDRPRPARPGLRQGAIGFSVPAPTVRALRELARCERASVFMVALAAFVVVLQRYSGQDDIAVGTPISMRDHPFLEPLLGNFINTVVLRCDASGDPTFRGLIGRVRETVLNAMLCKNTAFEQVIRELGLARELSRNPLFQVSFQVEDTMVTDNPIKERIGEVMNAQGFGTTVANLDLNVHLFGAPVDGRTNKDEMGGIATYDAELFDESSVKRMIDVYLSVLSQMMDSAERHLSDLPLSTVPPQAPPASVRPLQFPVAEIRRWAREAPDTPAVLGNGSSISYGSLLARAEHVAAGLEARGWGVESLVGVSCRPGIERVIGILATMLAGAPFVPLAWDDPPQRLAWMSATLDVILVGRAEYNEWPGEREKLLPIDVLEDPAAARQPRCSGLPVADEALAYGIWTSGSTGKPKLALNTHGGIARIVAWMNANMPLRRGERVLHHTALTFDVSLLELLRPLAAGATIVCADVAQANDPQALSELVRKHDVTTAHFVPSMLSEFLAIPGYLECTSLRRIVCIGEMLTPALVAAARSKDGIEIVNMYGPAEAAVAVTHHRCIETADAPFVSIGRPFADGEMLVLDHVGQPAPVGVPGELYLAGAQIGRGYASDPALTAERWIPHPWGAPGARMYRTGDRARRGPDGSYELLGRVDHMVKLRGQRIELEGVEAIAAGMQGVGAAAARLIRDSGRSDALVLWVVPSPPEAELDSAAVRARLAAHLPRGMLPSQIYVIDKMPRNRSGKIDRAALQPRSALDRRQLAPRDPVELRVMDIWSELLQRHDLSVDDDFFTVGGHSLLAVRLLSRINDQLGSMITLAAFYPRPTIEGIALALRAAAPETAQGLVCLRRGEEGAPVLFLFPGAGGRAITYLQLARHLPSGFTVWAFEHGMPSQFNSVEEAAEEFIREMRTAAPAMPWHVGGWSAGAAIAFEVARKLREEGTPVASLSLFDALRPYRPAVVDTDPGNVTARILAMIGANLAAYYGRPQVIEEERRLRELDPEARLEHFLGDVRRRELVPEDFTDAMVREFLLASVRHVRAVWSYVPGIGEERTALFRAMESFDWPTDQEAELARDDAFGWREIVRGPLRVVPVAGNHVSMFQDGQVEELATALAGFITGTETGQGHA